MSETTEKLIALAAKRFKVDAGTLGPDDDFFKKLGINSFQALALLSDLENEFNVEIPDYELQGVFTFSALSKLIEKRK